MILWAGFIGKLLDFILSKVIAKKVEMRLDERKNAARAFLQMYEALIALESVTAKFKDETTAVITGSKARLLRDSIEQLAHEADLASMEFEERVVDFRVY
jgi:hypothetical protein